MIAKPPKQEQIDILFDFYLANQSRFVADYEGKFIVLYENEVRGAFDSSGAAYDFAMLNYQPGKFLIQKCSQGDRDYTVHLFSRIRI
jgi:hypothetical protein